MQTLTSSIIVCSRNRLDDIIIMLESVRRQSLQPTEIIIVDSSAKPYDSEPAFTTIFCARLWPQTRLAYCQSKPGLTLQRNVGIDRAQADIIYFFDDDVILDPDYLGVMHHFFAANPHYAAGMGSISNIEPLRRGKHRFFRTLFMLPRDYASGHFTYSGMPTHAYGNRSIMRVSVLGGCCMAYRSSILKQYRFDEQLPAYGYMEDADISFRIAQEHPLFFHPDAQLLHNNSPVSRDGICANRAMFMQHYCYLFFKNVYPRNRLKVIAWAWSILGLFLEAAMVRDRHVLAGYLQGLKQFFRSI